MVGDRLLEKPIDVIVSISGYMKQGYCIINAKISECTLYCTIGNKSYKHILTGVDFNKLINALSLLDIEFKVS